MAGPAPLLGILSGAGRAGRDTVTPPHPTMPFSKLGSASWGPSALDQRQRAAERGSKASS